jgi:hypothetical protein
MPPTRLLSCLIAAVLVFPFPAAAFETPLSDTAVREAYFLGQRHDETLALFLDKYSRHLPPPKSGPAITTITFLTPFALVAQLSSRQSVYSAQQAEIDHRNNGESVHVVVEIQYIDMAHAAALPFGPPAFWKDYETQVLQNDRLLKPRDSSVDPIYTCSDSGCFLTGTALSFDFCPESFTTDTVTVRVIPPQGDSTDVSFDPTALR